MPNEFINLQKLKTKQGRLNGTLKVVQEIEEPTAVNTY